MRLLKRNTSKIKHYQYFGLANDKDENGFHTGEYKKMYYLRDTLIGTVSTPAGTVSQAFNGLDIRYSYTIVFDDPDTGIKEADVIEWNGNLFDVKAVRPSLNYTLIAILENTNDNGDQYIEGDDDEDEDGEGGEGGDEPTEPEEPEEPEPEEPEEPVEPEEPGTQDGEGE